jgi:beta-lactamase regulating signal transducer with metallopeptidase domain
MNELATILLWSLLRTGLVMSGSALVLSLLLRLFRVASPTVRRVAYFAVVLQGCLFLQWPVAIALPTFVPVATVAWDHLAQRAPAHQGDALDEPQQVARSARARPSRPHPTRSANGPHTANILSGVALGSSTEAESPRAAAPPPPYALPWALGLAVLWGTGIVFLVGRSAWSYARFVRRLPPLQNVETEWAAEWDALQRQAGLRTLVPLAVAEQMGPVLCRLPRGYRLIVPALAWQRLEPAQRQLVLRHELAHIERRDVWKSLLMRVLALPHWFNPLVWRMVARFDECAEWACDDATRQAAPDHLSGYARALLQLAHRADAIFFATRAARGDGLSHRIRRLLVPAQEKGSNMKTAVMAILLLGISLLNGSRLQSRADAQPPTAVKDISAPPAAKTDARAAQKPENRGDSITIKSPVAKRESATGKVAELAHDGPRLARIDMAYVLKNMREFQRRQQWLTRELRSFAKVENVEEDAIRVLRKRVHEEKDGVVRDLFDKAIMQRKMEFAWRRAADTSKLVADETEMYHTLLDKIVAETARYAKEHKIFTVLSVNTPRLADVTIPALPAPPSQAAGAPTLTPPPPAATPAPIMPAAAPAQQAALLPPPMAWAPAAPLPPPMAPMVPRHREAWDEEVIYLLGRDSAQEIDISEEILKRLNSTDVKNEKLADPKVS